MLRTLISIQRIRLLKIAKVYCTDSNISLPILCNCLPIEILLDIENFMFQLFQLRIYSKFENLTVDPKYVTYPIDPWTIQPAKNLKSLIKNTTLNLFHH